MRLEARKLIKVYKGRRVVDGIDLYVDKGEIVGLLGANGAGKTTSFYMMVGFVRPTKGQVLLNDKDITRLAMYQRARRGLGYLAQESSVFRKLSVQDNLRLVLEMRVRGRKKRQEIIEKLLDEFSLGHLRKHRADTLSGGERRRLEIARALSVEPHFLLLDEPFTGVDPKSIEDIQTIIQDLKNRGLGVLVTDHSVRETLAITDRTYLMEKGHIIESGTPYDIASSELAREKYLGKKFSFAGLDLAGAKPETETESEQDENEEELVLGKPALLKDKTILDPELAEPPPPTFSLSEVLEQESVEPEPAPAPPATEEDKETEQDSGLPAAQSLSRTLDEIEEQLRKKLPENSPEKDGEFHEET